MTAFPDHGTNARYVKGCRCSECREAKRLYMREYRTAKRQGTYAFRSSNGGVVAGRLLAADAIAGRVGHDFPAVGTGLRALAVMSA